MESFECKITQYIGLIQNLNSKMFLNCSYGRPGVEFHFQLENETEIRQLVFIENRGQLVAVCSDSSLHFLEINTKETQTNVSQGVLECSKSCDYFAKESSKEGSLKQITTVSINSRNDLLLIGTQSGNTFLVDLDKFEITDQIIYQDVVLQNIPEDFKFSPGSVEVIAEQPLHPNKFLIGYNRGLLVLWDNEMLSADHFYVANQVIVIKDRSSKFSHLYIIGIAIGINRLALRWTAIHDCSQRWKLYCVEDK